MKLIPRSIKLTLVILPYVILNLARALELVKSSMIINSESVVSPLGEFDTVTFVIVLSYTMPGSLYFSVAVNCLSS